jgi:hypothetical protein
VKKKEERVSGGVKNEIREVTDQEVQVLNGHQSEVRREKEEEEEKSKERKKEVAVERKEQEKEGEIEKHREIERKYALLFFFSFIHLPFLLSH